MKLWKKITQTARRAGVIVMHHPKALFLAGIIIGSFFGYTISVLVTEASYRLSNGSVQLIGAVNPVLADKLKLDKNMGAYRFNADAITPEMIGETDPSKVAALLASQKQQTGGGSKDSQNLYSLDLPIDPSEGTKIYDTNSKTSFKLIPEFEMGAGRSESGRVVYPIDEGGQAVYTVKANGIKEDIVLQKPRGDELSFKYKLELPKTLEARLDDHGNLGIYSVDPMVSSAIAGALQNGASSTDTERLKDVQENGTKDHLAYLIPAPTIVQSGDQPSAHKARAIYKLSGDSLTVSTSGLEALTYPISIDPSVVVTSTADFATGNQEGNISFDVDAISRAEPTGGSTGSWTTATTSFTTGRHSHASVAYNGYLYVIGGQNNGGASYSDVQYAPLNADGTVGTWTATTSLSDTRDSHTSVAYNGYLYVIGGYRVGDLSDVQYAPLNADGTVGTWTATTSFTTARNSHTSVVYNGFLYVIGGGNGSYLSDIQYAPINANGTVGTWAATTSFTTGRHSHTSVVYNGYLYVIGGYDAANRSDVQYAPLNANGTVGTWTATTSFTTARHGHSSVVQSGYIYVIGGWTGSGTFYSDVQYAPLNANGTVGTWTTTTGLAAGRTNQASIIYKDNIYIIGGNASGTVMTDVQYAKNDPLAGPVAGLSSWAATTSFGAGAGSPGARVTTRANHGSAVYNGYIYLVGGTGSGTTITNVHYAPLNANGTVGAWAVTTSLPLARAGLASVAVNGYLYAIGGQDASSVFATTSYYAPINANGTIGTWATTTVLTSARSDQGMVSYNGYMYVTGGITTGGTRIATVEYAVINANGTLGTWTATTTLAVARGAHGSAAYNGFIYVIGGSDGTTTPSVVLYAAINANGTLGSWNSTTTMAEKRSYIDARIFQDHIFITGGWDGASTEHNTVAYAKINTDGTIGSWNSGPTFTTGRDSHGTEIHNGYIYITGGWNGSTVYGDVQYAQLTYGLPGNRGTTGSWAATTSFTTARHQHKSVAHNGYLYVLGGFLSGTGTLSDVQYAPINANGTIGAWATTTSLSIPRSNFGALVINGFLYVVGGETTNSYLSDVQYAPINANGTIGSWTTTTSFTTARYDPGVVAYGGYLYVIGGMTGGGATTDVQYAPINANGTIGTWTTTTSLTTARFKHGAAAYNGYLYVTGGNTIGAVTLSTVHYAPINSNGTLGTWAATTSLPGVRHSHTFAVYGGQLFVFGGSNSNASSLTSVLFAQINANGTIGFWMTSTAFPTGRENHASAIYNGYVYMTGGYTDTVLINEVLVAQLNMTPFVAQYTKRINLGQVSTLNGVTLNGSYAGGQKTVSIKVAGADGVFGNWQSTSDLSVTPIPNVQYVMFKLSLDDSFGLASLAATGGRSTINDVTLSYTLPVTLTTENRLRNNKHFDPNGVLQPLQTQ